MLKRIYADNFLCLGNFELRPKRLNLLLGENGTGKTSLFEALLRVRNLSVLGGTAAQQFPLNTKTIWDRREIQAFELDVEGLEGTFSYRLEIQHPPQASPLIRGETLDFEGKPLFRYRDGQVQLFDDEHEPGATFPFKPEQSFLPNLGEQNSKLQWFKGFVAGIQGFQLNPFALDSFSQQDERNLNSNGSNFVSWLRYLSEEKPQARRECEERLAELLPGFQGFRFQALGDRKGLMASFRREGGDDYELYLRDLSEGQRILAILYSILYGLVGETSVLCIDEPENFISLQEVQPWLQGLRDLVEERSGQALVISHHPEVIDYLASDSAFLFERPTGDLVRVSPWVPDPTMILRPSEVLVRGG